MDLKTESACPPAVWGWTLLTAVVAMAALVVPFRVHGGMAKFEAYQGERLKAFESRLAQTPGGLPVVALGDSLLGALLIPDRYVEARLRKQSGRPIRHLTITRHALSLMSFDGLWPSILAQKPALVVFEADVLAQSTMSPLEFQAQQMQAFMSAALESQWILLNPRNSVPLKPAMPKKGEEGREERIAQRIRDMKEEHRFEGRPSELAVRRVREAMDAGARVLVLDTPRTGQFEAIRRDAKVAWLRQLRELVHDDRLRTAQYAGSLESSMYWDKTHLNGFGRQVMAPWYDHELIASLPKDDRR